MKTNTPATLLTDFYKFGHRVQYPENTQFVFSTWIARSNKHYPKAESVIALNFQGFIKKYLIDYFDKNFFSRKLGIVIAEYVRYCKCCLFQEDVYTDHIYELWKLQHLPIMIKAIPEGTRVPFRVPMLTIQNTDERFFWVTNFLETLISCELWPSSTTATIADIYKKILVNYAKDTSSNIDFVQFQGHDFSMRGSYGMEASKLAGIGHLTSFSGTDTVPAIDYLEKYYFTNMTKELIGCSVNATEHSVMCAGEKDSEYETYRRLIEDVYSNGIISIVSDTWDLWNTVTEILPKLKDSILSRDGKVVIRPDSGDPVDIICGTVTGFDSVKTKPEEAGLIELLWNIFGGIVNEKGYKELDSHIGAIYGDSITPERCETICKRLKDKGFASTNIIFGIGSFTYQMITRDSLGFAMKATSCVVNGEDRMLFKDPATDDGTKKSLKGACVVQYDENGEMIVVDNLKFNNDLHNELQTIFENGQVFNLTTLDEIRKRISDSI